MQQISTATRLQFEGILKLRRALIQDCANAAFRPCMPRKQNAYPWHAECPPLARASDVPLAARHDQLVCQRMRKAPKQSGQWWLWSPLACESFWLFLPPPSFSSALLPPWPWPLLPKFTKNDRTHTPRDFCKTSAVPQGCVCFDKGACGQWQACYKNPSAQVRPHCTHVCPQTGHVLPQIDTFSKILHAFLNAPAFLPVSQTVAL